MSFNALQLLTSIQLQHYIYKNVNKINISGNHIEKHTVPINNNSFKSFIVPFMAVY